MAEFIELNSFIKINRIASTGGQAKLLIRSGKVLVNGVVETRNRKKLVVGDKIEIDGKIFIITKEMIIEKD